MLRVLGQLGRSWDPYVLISPDELHVFSWVLARSISAWGRWRQFCRLRRGPPSLPRLPRRSSGGIAAVVWLTLQGCQDQSTPQFRGCCRDWLVSYSGEVLRPLLGNGNRRHIHIQVHLLAPWTHILWEHWFWNWVRKWVPYYSIITQMQKVSRESLESVITFSFRRRQSLGYWDSLHS